MLCCMIRVSATAAVDHLRSQTADRELVHSHDRNISQDLLDQPGRPSNGTRAAGLQRARFRIYCPIIEKTATTNFLFQRAVRAPTGAILHPSSNATPMAEPKEAPPGPLRAFQETYLTSTRLRPVFLAL
jgi:hypothetical protein